jgi:hypothetical protein
MPPSIGLVGIISALLLVSAALEPAATCSYSIGSSARVPVLCKLGKFGVRDPRQLSAELVAAEPLDGCESLTADATGQIGQLLESYFWHIIHIALLLWQC